MGDRVNLVYQGTEITTGRGIAVVTATGMNTELGKIAALLQSVENQPTPLQQKLTQLGNVLVMGALIIVALTKPELKQPPRIPTHPRISI